VDVTFEQRPGLSVGVLKKWYARLSELVLLTAFEYPFIESMFPEVTFRIGTKVNFGIQICDFLLWTSMRAFENNKVWWDRLSPKFKTTTTPEVSPWFGGSLHYQDFDNHDEPSYGAVHSPTRNDRSTWNEALGFYIQGEKLLEHLEIDAPIPIAHHLHSIKAYNSTKNKLSNKRVETGARLILMVLDTANIVLDEDDEYKKLFLRFKKSVGFLLHTDRLDVSMLNDYINRYLERGET